MKQDHKPLPAVSGYKAQSLHSVAGVNRNKELEERTLRRLDEMANDPAVDKRWLAIGRTHLEQAWMAINRAIFQPGRVTLPEEVKPKKQEQPVGEETEEPVKELSPEQEAALSKRIRLLKPKAK